MYGRTEHRYHMRRLGDVSRELDCQREIVGTLIHEAHADFDANERELTSSERETIDRLRAARVLVTEAICAIDQVAASLPTPVAL